jgi:hypothetical protein
MIDFICIDVDGTLVGRDGTVRPAVWAAVDEARAAGIRLALCSGRPAMGRALEYAARLDPDGWHIFQNGASVLHLPTGESRSFHLPAPAVERLVARARRRGEVLELYTDTDYAVEHDADRARRHAALLGVPFRPRALESAGPGVVRAQWLVPHAVADAVEAEARGDAGVTVSPSLSPVMPDTRFFSVTSGGIDKASAVRSVAAAYGVPLERVMMVGDGANDAPAMRIVGHPVAMGDAEPEAMAAARHVVADAEGDGLAQALRLALRLRAEAGSGSGR